MQLLAKIVSGVLITAGCVFLLLSGLAALGPFLLFGNRFGVEATPHSAWVGIGLIGAGVVFWIRGRKK